MTILSNLLNNAIQACEHITMKKYIYPIIAIILFFHACANNTLDKRKSEALDNLQQLLAICPTEKDYITDLIDVIKTYDDLSNGELKYLAALVVRKANAAELVVELKQKIPVHYIIQIKTRVEAIDSQAEIIMFTEDLRNDND